MKEIRNKSMEDEEKTIIKKRHVENLCLIVIFIVFENLNSYCESNL